MNIEAKLLSRLSFIVSHRLKHRGTNFFSVTDDALVLCGSLSLYPLVTPSRSRFLHPVML
jgi:hypothetical protein